jgi:dTDP-glucose 4,6-dehydratase
MKRILVTGGCGFIGTNFIKFLFNNISEEHTVVNVDKLTYAANPENLMDIEQNFPTRYFFEKADISDIEKIEKIIDKYEIDTIVNFAAESHVDRSIIGPQDFIQTNIIGTFCLLELVRKFQKMGKEIRFHQVSTDEVYGSLQGSEFFSETAPYNPSSPYSASKASADLLVKSYVNTYKIPATISLCSNNYGPYQFPEKLIPLMILNMLEGKELPVYGDGLHIRDWLFVEDHCSAIWMILQEGKIGESYNIGGNNQWENLKLIQFLATILAEKTGRNIEDYTKLIRFVKDRPGHDRRYAINSDKIRNELGWKESFDFTTGLRLTVDWYLNNLDWVEKVRSGDYLKWIEINYRNR